MPRNKNSAFQKRECGFDAVRGDVSNHVNLGTMVYCRSAASSTPRGGADPESQRLMVSHPFRKVPRNGWGTGGLRTQRGLEKSHDAGVELAVDNIDEPQSYRQLEAAGAAGAWVEVEDAFAAVEVRYV